ncbi:mechanosensitive ion channel domain-containing protein [Flavobacterium sp. LC2016-01]|uniref:mechanosensitive ion channel family protein n=1 Tax=Flavobacterium sp. LC2016-01 TaxID=2675876 RepID=UPI0012BAD2CD|nr:mechanosensitive ion channel domain-containing protein [Flavobacterium sp. LC2016-01]MTH15559.1 mechanosensitive ion channel [Flavobacterium sp. LC2016-01]
MAFYNLIPNRLLYKNAKLQSLVSKTFTVLFFFFSQFYVSYSQNQNLSDSTKSDGKNSEYNKIENLLEQDEEKSNTLFKENQISRERAELFDAISKNIQKADLTLKTGIDYKGFTSELDYVITLKKTAIDGIIKNKNDFQTLRNITVTSIMLKELQTRVEIQLAKINKNRLELSEMQSIIDSLTIKKSLFTLPKDSLRKALYYERYSQMNSDVGQLNKRFKDALDSISKLQIIGSRFKFDLQNDIIETDNIRKNEFQNLLHSDGDIFNPNEGNSSFIGAFFYSLTKVLIILLFFITNHFNAIILMLLAASCLIIYLLFLKNKYIKEGLYDTINVSKQIFIHPVSCAILVSFTVFNFLFIFPPFAFTTIIWLISIIALTVVNKEHFCKKEKFVWKIYVVLILLGLYDNNILIHSVTEVYFILFIAAASAIFSIYNLKKNKEILNPFFKYSLIVMIICEKGSIFFILFDSNYNLGKLLMINGIITILMYYLFTNTYRLILDIIRYSNFLKESNEGTPLEANELETIHYSPIINTLFIIGWFISIVKNSYFFHAIIDPIIAFFNEPRTIGAINYSYQSIIIFFFIIITSVLIAKIVSFLTSSSSNSSNTNRKNKFGSWILLVQIAIFSIGISLAFISAGIPVDRLTIIISALGVGIGFGLQTLVNNLVSGLIIAFEKPVNINDTIEIGGQTVKMKSIGIRSSVVATFDGADVIIPNGDLLSQHLTNWTLSNYKKRTDIVIGVAYGTNLEKVKDLLNAILEAHSLVLQIPEPIIWITEFKANSIDIVVKYWVNNINDANEVKSDLIISIDKVFRENNIEIPFPQQDIHIIHNNTTDSEKK